MKNETSFNLNGFVKIPDGANKSEKTTVPRVKFEWRPEIRGRGQIEAEAGQVDGGVGHEEQDGAQLSDLVQRSDEETHAWKFKKK